MNEEYRIAWAPTNYYPTEAGVISSGGHFLKETFANEISAKHASLKLNLETNESAGSYFVIY